MKKNEREIKDNKGSDASKAPTRPQRFMASVMATIISALRAIFNK